MRDEMFDALLESVRQGGAILRGEMEAARTTRIDVETVQLLRGEIAPDPSSRSR